MIVIVMGVSGSGKSTVGHLLAKIFGCEFRDGDEFHPAANVAKMQSGQALNDEDRHPWLQSIQEYMLRTHAVGGSAVVACSALKESYRDILLRGQPWVRFVHLTGPKHVIAERMQSRSGHYMPVTLLESQLATLETPVDALAEDIRRTPEQIADSIADRIRRQ